jgi:DNA-binding NtrC family response regulator
LATGLLIDIDDLPQELRNTHTLPVTGAHVRPLQEVEREYILAALQNNGVNKTQTAVQLQINAATLFRKLKRYARPS